MRVIAGEFGGRRLINPTDNTVRPTSDRVRESMFAILASSYPEAFDETRVLDVFAGTGALAIEALSRGAQYAHFIEQSPQSIALIKDNIDTLGIAKQTKIQRADATRLRPLGKLPSFNLIFADPPYAKGLAEKALTCLVEGGWLAPQAIVIIEEKANVTVIKPDGFFALDQRKFGDTNVVFWRYQP